MNGQQWLDLFNNIVSLVAVANPAAAGAATAIEGGVGLITSTVLPGIKAAAAKGELTPEQEAKAYADAEAFWKGVADGSAFAGAQWQKTTTPGQ